MILRLCFNNTFILPDFWPNEVYIKCTSECEKKYQFRKSATSIPLSFNLNT